MSRDADKHIRVTEETWLQLNKKKRPGDSFDDVLQRLLDEDAETAESGLWDCISLCPIRLFCPAVLVSSEK